jgi:hypothetical protein
LEDTPETLAHLADAALERLIRATSLLLHANVDWVSEPHGARSSLARL